MSLKKAVVSTFVGVALAGAAASASAQQVESGKTAQYSLLPNFHGSVDLRQYSFKSMSEKDGDKRLPAVQSRAILGSSFMDGKLDVTGILAVTAKPQTEKLKQRNPQLDIKYTNLDTTHFEIDTILTVYSAHETSPMQAYPDLYAETRYPADLAIGKLTATLSGEWNVRFITAQQDSTIENESGRPASELGLTVNAEGDATRPKEDLDAAAQYVGSMSLATGKFVLTASQFLDQVYNPRYVAGADGSVEVSRPVKTSVTEGFKVAYKITDKTTVSNETYLQQGGVFESQFDGADDNKGLYAFSNIAKIAYKL